MNVVERAIFFFATSMTCTSGGGACVVTDSLQLDALSAIAPASSRVEIARTFRGADRVLCLFFMTMLIGGCGFACRGPPRFLRKALRFHSLSVRCPRRCF